MMFIKIHQNINCALLILFVFCFSVESSGRISKSMKRPTRLAFYALGGGSGLVAWTPANLLTQTFPQTATLTNSTASAITGSSFNLNVNDGFSLWMGYGGYFEIEGGASSTCGSSLAAGQACVVTVTFQYSDPCGAPGAFCTMGIPPDETFTQTLTATHSGGTTSIQMSTVVSHGGGAAI